MTEKEVNARQSKKRYEEAMSRQRAQNPKKTIRRLLSYFRFNRGTLILALILTILTALCQIASDGLISPALDALVADDDFSAFLMTLLKMGILGLIAVLSSWFGSKMMVTLAQKTVYILRKELEEKILRLPLSYFDTHPIGESMSYFSNDIDILTRTLELSVGEISLSLVSFIGTLVMMFIISWKISLLICLMLVLMFFFTRWMTRRSGRYYRERQAKTADLNSYVEEMINAQKLVKIFNHESQAMDAFSEEAESLRETTTYAVGFARMNAPFAMNYSFVLYALTAMLGSLETIRGSLTIGQLAAYLKYVPTVTRPVSSIAEQINDLVAAIAGAERIFALLDLEEEAMEGPVRLTEGSGEKGLAWAIPNEEGGETLVPVRGHVRFDHVNFGYQPDRQVLYDISFYAKPGQKVAFVGSTGAGKTTITNLLNRFYEIWEGEISVDGIDIRKINKYDLRSIMAVVLQEVNLFSGSIADNIRFGRLDASDIDLVQAAKTANAHPFISQLQNGYDTYLVSGGNSLSQGQKQLISIARAAVSDPLILILDEATSSIDTRTEKMNSLGMDQLMKGRTTLVIAHRLSTVRNANVILVLEAGRIVERGSHEELLALHGLYYKLNAGLEELQ